MNVKNKLKYLALVIIISGLVFPKPILAFIGTGVFDFFSTALGGIEEISGPVAKMLFIVLMAYIIGIVCLYTSASLLELVIENPGWLSLSGNTMVKSGWDIISGLSNMFFILVFIIITLAIILKIESFEAKKLLPKLLIVALLVNFSLVFIGILVDISTIFYNTILTEENEGLPVKVINILGVDGQNIVEQLITQIIALAVAFVVPIFGPFAQLGLVLGIISLGYISNIIIWIVQSICFFMMSGILFTYAFLFAARIYIIQLLAMLAPLAFLCSVLPQTKKYWDEWLKTIVEWIFLGIILFLFLVLGLRATKSLLPPVDITSIPLLAWGNLPTYFPYYFFLFVYLTTTLWLSKKYMPDLAKAMIEQGNIWSKMIWSRGLKPMGGALAGAVKDSYKEVVRRQPEAEKELERRRVEGEKVGLFRRARVGAGKAFTLPAKVGARLRKTTLKREQAKEVDDAVEKLKSTFGEDIVSAIKVYGGKTGYSGAMRAALPLYLAKTKGEEGIDKFEEIVGDKFKKRTRQSVDAIAGNTPYMLKDFIKHKPGLIEDEEVGKLIQKTMVDKGLKDKDVEAMTNSGIKIRDKKEELKTVRELIDAGEGDKVIEHATYKKAMQALKSGDIDTLSNKTTQDKTWRRMAARYQSWSFMNKLATEKGINLEEIQDEIENDKALGKDNERERINEIAKTNPYFIRAPYTPAGVNVMRPWKGIKVKGKKGVNARLKEVREDRRKLEREVREKKVREVKEEVSKLKKELLEEDVIKHEPTPEERKKMISEKVEKDQERKKREELMERIVIPKKEILERADENYIKGSKKEGYIKKIRTMLEPKQTLTDWLMKEAEKELKREKVEEKLKEKITPLSEKEKAKRARTQLNKFLEDLDYSKEEKRKFFERLEKKDRKKALEEIKKELEKLAFKEKGKEGLKASRKSWKQHEEIIKWHKQKEEK
ncbi:MAG: hypothetical protein ACKKMV_00970 [Candidatus Nealsonbacteria bacterium]